MWGICQLSGSTGVREPGAPLPAKLFSSRIALSLLYQAPPGAKAQDGHSITAGSMLWCPPAPHWRVQPGCAGQRASFLPAGLPEASGLCSNVRAASLGVPARAYLKNGDRVVPGNQGSWED